MIKFPARPQSKTQVSKTQVSKTRLFKTTLSLVTTSVATVYGVNTAAAESDTLRSIEVVASQLYDALDALWPEQAVVPGLQVQLGGGLGFSPDFKGANDYDLSVIPIIRLQYKDLVIFTGNTIKYNAYRRDNLVAGISARYVSGRKERDNDLLRGLGNINATLSIGPYVEYRLDPVRLSAELRQGLGAGDGTQIRLNATMGLFQNERWGVQAAAGTTWGSGLHLRTRFGITPTQAAHSPNGLAAYRPGSGFYEVSLSVGGQYMLTENVRLVQFFEYARLLGNAAGSPLVKAGSPNQLAGGGGVIFSF